MRAYFSVRPEFAPTPLRSLTSVANELGVAEVHAKDETHRFGINAFKIVGVSYAVDRLGEDEKRRGLVCATAGNHGRAVARVAREKRLPCTVFVPTSKTSRAESPQCLEIAAGDQLERATREARVDAMRADGATVIDVDGTYEEAVRRAAAFGADTGATIVSDTSWDGYERIPRLIMAGYTQILEEASTQWDAPPTLVIVQGGVGGLVCAAASWFAHRFGKVRPLFVAAEPENAACLMMSAQAGRPITVDSSLDTIMAGLRCAEPSPVAWPAIAQGVDAFVTVPDVATIESMRVMSVADQRIDAGPSGACGLAALTLIAGAPEFEEFRSTARIDGSTRAMVIVTEGA